MSKGFLWATAVAAGLAAAICAAAAQDKKAAATAPAPKSSPSPCKGLDQAACGAASACQWIAPKSGKQKPYCRLKPKGKKAVAPQQAPAGK